MRSPALAICAALAVGVGSAAYSGAASADTYQYTVSGVPYGVNAVVNPLGQDAYVGGIQLTNGVDTSTSPQTPLPDQLVYCVDLYGDIYTGQHYTFTPGTWNSNTSTSLTVAHAAQSTTGGVHNDLSLAYSQVQTIAALMVNGAAAAVGTAENDLAQAATQLAVWETEYGTTPTVSLSTSDTSSGLNGNPSVPTSYAGVDLTGLSWAGAVNAVANQYLTNASYAGSSGSGWLNHVYNLTLFNSTNTSAQDLTYAVATTGTLTTPLPASLSLFASGVIAIGGAAGWRRRKRKAAAI